MTRFVIALVVLAACSRDAVPTPDAAPARARFAMGYAPTTPVAADGGILRAQAEVRRAPETAEPYVALATAFLQRARWSRNPAFLVHADDALAAARALGGRGAALSVAAIVLASEQHRFAEAQDGAARLVAAAPADPIGHLLLGDARLELGDIDGAADAYQRAVDLRPDLRSYERAAHVRWLDGDVEGAVEMLGRALDAASPRDPEPAAWCYAALGGVAWLRGDLRGAAVAAERALALVPGYPGALLVRARVLAARGDRGGALAALDAVAVPARTVEELALRVDVLRALGRAAEADRVAADIGRRAAGDPREVARVWARYGAEPERAARIAGELARERPTIEALAVAALAEARTGRVAEARAVMARARRLGTRDPRLALYAAVIELAAGERDAARRLVAAAPAVGVVDPVLAAEVTRRLEAP
jgi:tetratricopeptide (TPR) repeat protein